MTRWLAATLALLAASAAADPPAVLLVGDSTMAPQTGYGDALCERLEPAVACLNLGRGGRSTLSYRAEGLWQRVIARLQAGEPGVPRHVLIQFGHNDQPGKPGRSTDLVSEFGPNLTGYVNEVRASGNEVLLLTPLTRRSFKDGQLSNDLRPWAEAVIRVGAETGVPVLDLNASSHAAVQALGQAGADALAEAPPRFDRTHLGPRGAALFADQVLHALLQLRPELAAAQTLRP